MLFLNGSPHRWYGDEKSTLLLSTDDATGKPLYGLFQKEEDLDGCFSVCQKVFTQYGLPGSFYLDRASHFTTTRHGGVHVNQSDQKPTQFERAMSELKNKTHLCRFSPGKREGREDQRGLPRKVSGRT